MANKTTTRTTGTASTQTTGQSTTKNVLDEALLAAIMGGLGAPMDEAQIRRYAENLLSPQLHAGLEAAQQTYDTIALAKEQEISDLAKQLADSIAAQRGAYARSMADVETAALARGMGRSSYTLDTLAAQGDALAGAVRALTQESERKTGQVRAQISEAARQKAQTQARLNNDYAAQLAAKIQELTDTQRQQRDGHYLTAISAAMGSQTTSSSQSSSQTSQKTTQTAEKTGASGSSGGTAKAQDAQSAAKTQRIPAPAVKSVRTYAR